MIQEDVLIFNQLFDVVSSGIPGNYDAFNLEITTGPGYIERLVEVEVAGEKSTDEAEYVDGPALCDLVRQLRANAESRHEPWQGFEMSYRRGEQVRISFTY